jgi:hypothetical protein
MCAMNADQDRSAASARGLAAMNFFAGPARRAHPP